MIAAPAMLSSVLALAEGPLDAHAAPELRWAGLALLLPLASSVLCLLCGWLKVRSKLPAALTIAALGGAFATILRLQGTVGETPVVVNLFDWIDLTWGDGSRFHGFTANVDLYIDRLTVFWMLFVTGLGTLIALYASEYMESDVGKGYTRFFGAVSIFLFAMGCLVMGGNLVMLYLGWEGVGLASYLLIGYYFTKPEAVAAAKKAFIVNRIGDLGLALALFLIWQCYGTVEYAALWKAIEAAPASSEWTAQAIPWLLMLGAFGKSAQLPLYVWLPDAMEGPTPVSALIHAATMVTAGVYLIARMFPLFVVNPDALAAVAWVGGLTALLAATIGMAQYDMKRIWAYSTISQLGYMFLGLGVGTTFGASYHVFTHAFFKALLFLTAGAVMHGFAGQLDIRKLSGLLKVPGFRLVSVLAVLGCFWLAAFPFTAAFFSKDEILVSAFTAKDDRVHLLGWIGLLVAALTAYYTFRVCFRVFFGPVKFEPGHELHGHDDHDHAHDAHAHHGEFHPHGPRWAIRVPLVLIAIGAILAGWPSYRTMLHHDESNWVKTQVAQSSAFQGVAAESHGSLDGHAASSHASAHTEDAHADHGHLVLGMDAHTAVGRLGSLACIVGILVSLYVHLINRGTADALRRTLMGTVATRWIVVGAERKWMVDEFYDWVIRLPLRVIANILSAIDELLLDAGIVNGIGALPAAVGRVFRPLYGGVVQGYAVTMAGGVALVAAWVIWIWLRGAN
ncbi:MAG: NADH-quinone oxidoreductase subunit L [Phycisphaerae bacterium]|nr:NADH-quinone oxidoreductase subunit L [Phycisphaerae bacterium]